MPVAGADRDAALRQVIVSAFVSRYGTPPEALVRAPGRINLIGEHTDYNDGFVLPMAIDRAVWIALRRVSADRVRLYSLDFDEEETFGLIVGPPPADGVNRGRWIEYVKGIAWALADSGFSLQGWDGVVAGDVPIGAGLSSSAALEMAAARSFSVVCEFDWDPPAMARLGQRAENGWVGVNCGIMDQMICAIGRRDHAVLVDCRTLGATPIPLPRGTIAVALDTGTRRRLVDSAFNERRAQCEAAAAMFGVSALRDLDMDRFSTRSSALNETMRRRARHVIGENARTIEAAQAMTAGDVRAVGALMYASHASLRDDFEVSNSALDIVAECARLRPECYGARMTGAGFGGCVVALVEEQHAGRFLALVGVDVVQAGGEKPNGFVFRAAEGANHEILRG